MFTGTDSDTFWLTITNTILGLVTLICVVAMGSGLYQDVKARVLARRRVRVTADDHAFVLPRLGITMADGGERIDRRRTSAGQTLPGQGPQDDPAKDDPGNIWRSNN